MGAMKCDFDLIHTRFQPGGETSILAAPNRFNGFHRARSALSLPETVETVTGESADGSSPG
jgi:hypothetical protein